MVPALRTLVCVPRASIMFSFLPIRASSSLSPPTTPAVFIMHTDGACRGNPGPSSAGIVIRNSLGALISCTSRFLGPHLTNNEAEYGALLFGLETASALHLSHLDVRCDSELVVRQVLGSYRVSSPNLVPLHARVVLAMTRFQLCRLSHVQREDNSEADALANAELDAQASNRSNNELIDKQ